MQYEDDDTTLTRTHKNYDDCLPLTPPPPFQSYLFKARTFSSEQPMAY